MNIPPDDRDKSDCPGGQEFNLFWMNPDGTGVEQLTSGETDWFPQFSPDGRTLAFHRWNDVHLLDVAGPERPAGPVRRLTVDPDNGMYPTWSPDGTQLAFMSWRGGTTAIYLMNADGSNQHLLVRMTTGSAIDPRWSPDGGSLVFVHVPEEAATEAQSATQSRHLYRVDAQTRAITRLR